MEYRDALKMLRGELGLSQTELANILHISVSTVSRWELGRTRPNRPIASLILDYAGAHGASAVCLDALKQSYTQAVKEKLGITSKNLYTAEQASLRQLIDEAAFPIYVCDMETDELLYLNQKARAMVSAGEPALGRKCYKCIMHRETPCEGCRKDELVEGKFKSFDAYRPFNEMIYHVQGKLIQWNGHRAQVRYVLGESPSVPFGNDAKVTSSVLADASEPVQTERQVVVSGHRLDAIMQNIDSAVTATIINSDGSVEFLFTNDLYHKILGYTKEEYLREVADPFQLIHPEDVQEVRSAAAGLRRVGEEKTLQYRVISRDGKTRWLRAKLSMMDFPDVDRPVQLSVLTDITELMTANRELAAKHDQIADMLNETPSGIAVVEVDPRDMAGSLHTVYYNDRFFSFSGYSRDEYDEMLRKNEMSFVFEEDVPLLLADTERICKGEIGVSIDTTIRCHTKDGGFRWLLLTGQLVGRRDEICIINISMVDVTARQEAVDRQRISEELLRIAAETDKRSMIVYDVKNNSCRAESRSLFSASYGETFYNIPQSLIDKGVAAKESVDELCAIFERIRKGEPEIKVSLQMRSGPDKYEWFECNATTVTDAEGQPDHAVLVFHNITEQRVKEAVFKKWQQSIVTRPQESFTLFRCNLSKNASLDQQDGDLLKIKFSAETLSFNERTRLYAEEYVYPDDRAAYLALLDSDTLLAMFYRGEHSAVLEYREINGNGETAWRRVTVETVEYLNSTDVQVFLMYEDIDEVKRAELAAKELADSDPLTGALNRAAFAERVDALIHRKPNTRCALIMLDMDGFKPLNDRFGHAAGDQALQDVVAVLRSYTGGGDLVGRLGGDEFLVLLWDIPYDAVIAKIAQQICEHIRKAYSQEVLLSASAGIAVYPRDGQSYDELYLNADKALYRVKQGEKGAYAFFSVAEEQQTPELTEALSAVREAPKSARGTKHRILIVDDSETNRTLLKSIFQDDYLIETAKNGAEALIRLRHFGVAISVVLLDLVMPGIDGYEVLRKMQSNAELRTIPVIVVTGDEERDTLLKVIESGAAEYVTKPVDIDIIRMRVQSVISKAENERLRAQNSYLMLQRDEEAKYRTVLDSTGTVVVEYNWINHVFIYGNEISKYIAGNFDHRSIWQVFLSDLVAETSDVKIMQDMLLELANSRGVTQKSKLIKLKTPDNIRHWFRMIIYKYENEFGLAERMIITFNDVHEEVLANEKLLFQATKDELTGLYNRAGFLEKAAELIAAKEPGYYVMACLDIEKFKVINDQYGTAKGDEILREFAESLKKLHRGENGICCRVTGDNFAVLYPASLLGTPELAQSHWAAEHLDSSIPAIRFAVGRCLVDDKTLSISAIYDRAAIAKDTVKGRYDKRIATYDESMRRAILRQQEITGQMNHALESGQFELWLQPQFNHSTGMLSGAEALARWRHPTEGLISPAEFIPIFERNGFVYELDKYIWEQTCILLRKWLDQGLSPVPVSVNISRYDVFRSDLIGIIEGLMERYRLPREMLRLEITESAFSESTDQIIKVVETLVELGFTVEIDDFGSGYSSLNTLKDVPAQILKMDMRFLENDKNAQRGGSIVESVVRMAKWLGMSVIAEGVETIEQADYLCSIGCKYIQGYLYSRPTQVLEYESLFAEGRAEVTLGKMRAVEAWNNNAFWNPTSMETLIFNSYVGGACIFEYSGGKTELLRHNESYAKMFGSHFKYDNSSSHNDILSVLDRGNAELLRGCLETAIAAKQEASCEVELRDVDREIFMYLRMTLRLIAQAGERYLFYCVVHDNTERRIAEKTAQQLMDDTPGGFLRMEIFEDKSPTIVSMNKGLCTMLGMTRDEVMAAYGSDIYKSLVPEDAANAPEEIMAAFASGGQYTSTFHLRRKDGGLLWLMLFGRFVRDEAGRLFLNAYFTDISERKEKDRLQRELLDNLPFGAAMYEFDGKQLSLVHMNKRYALMVNRKAADMLSGYSPVDYIHPDNRKPVFKEINAAIAGSRKGSVDIRLLYGEDEYRSFHLDANIVPSDGGKYMIYVAYSPAAERK